MYIYIYIYIADIARILENMPRGRRQYWPNELASEVNIASARGGYFRMCGLYMIYYMTKKYTSWTMYSRPITLLHIKERELSTSQLIFIETYIWCAVTRKYFINQNMHYICNVITFVRHFIKRQSLILEMAWRHIRWYQLILQLVKNYQIMPFSLKKCYLKCLCLFAQENTIRNRIILDSILKFAWQSRDVM